MKKIKIGVDIRDLRIAKTGAKTYLEELCNEFRKPDNQFDFVFIDTPIPVYSGSNKLLKLVEHLRFILWKQIMLPIKARVANCDIVFCTDFFVPVWNFGFRTIPVFHDAFLWEYPQHYNKYWLRLFFILGVGAAKRSPYIITSSAYAKERIVALSRLPAEKIIAIYEAPKKIKPAGRAAEVEIPVAIKEILAHDLILHVGTFEKRKNLGVLVKAFGLLQQAGYTDTKLVLLGQASSKKYLDDSENIIQLVSDKNLSGNVFMPGYVSNEVLDLFYQHALLYVFPSKNEGFGIPVLEAFSYDLPVIIANNSCLPEIAGDAAISFDPDDADQLFTKMKMLLDDEKLRQELIIKMRKRLAFFSWKKTAIELKAIFKKAVRD